MNRLCHVQCASCGCNIKEEIEEAGKNKPIYLISPIRLERNKKGFLEKELMTFKTSTSEYNGEISDCLCQACYMANPVTYDSSTDTHDKHRNNLECIYCSSSIFYDDLGFLLTRMLPEAFEKHYVGSTPTYLIDAKLFPSGYSTKSPDATVCLSCISDIAPDAAAGINEGYGEILQEAILIMHDELFPDHQANRHPYR